MEGWEFSENLEGKEMGELVEQRLWEQWPLG